MAKPFNSSRTLYKETECGLDVESTARVEGNLLWW